MDFFFCLLVYDVETNFGDSKGILNLRYLVK